VSARSASVSKVRSILLEGPTKLGRVTVQINEPDIPMMSSRDRGIPGTVEQKREPAHPSNELDRKYALKHNRTLLVGFHQTAEDLTETPASRFPLYGRNEDGFANRQHDGGGRASDCQYRDPGHSSKGEGLAGVLGALH